jgi:glycine/D-amino acid oxidase-like deaminating enzyme
MWSDVRGSKRGRKFRVRIAVIGGGLVGSLAALFAAQDGHTVEILERESELWAGASAANEGKIHLGAVFALGSARTHDVMIRGALAFGPMIDAAVGYPVEWDTLTGEPFEHLVMPDSLATPDELAAAYAAINHRLAALAGGADRYLGARLTRVADTAVSRDADTGLPRFATSERAVHPLRLRALVLESLGAHPRVVVRTGAAVTDVRTDADAATVVTAFDTENYDAVVNAAWAEQNRFSGDPRPRNFRLKTGVRLAPGLARRTVTLVQGPYGDVVAHRDGGYASWYPSGRLVNEFGLLPSRELEDSLTGLPARHDLVRSQLAALADIGILEPSLDGDLVGGVIVGDGATDIEDPRSLLHSRAEFGVDVHGRILTPASFKFTTAPLAARVTADAIGRWT